MSDVFDVVLLFALPASGKSEVRKFMASMDPEVLKKDFHIGENLQLDDFPYVHMMRRIDDELEKMGEPRVFYPGEEPLIDGRDWSTLIQLLNEDYHDMVNHNVITTDSAAKLLFDRIDRAALIDGISPRLGKLREEVYEKLAGILEKESRDLLDEKQNAYPKDMVDKTIIIEAARGGKDGSSMPLTDFYGYQYSIPYLCPELLKKAAILYILVTPEESRRKNEERSDPNDPGSILNHGVPLSVMLNDYGCDDMAYLLETSEVKDTITIKAHGETYHIPVGIFDNREDKTTFLRGDKELWPEEKVKEMTEAVRKATDTMYKNYKGE